MENQPAMAMFLQKRQPLTPVSPSLPTTLPHVCEAIPQLPITPPNSDDYPNIAANEEAIQTALHVLSTERDALSHLGKVYESDMTAQEGFINSVNTILKTVRRGGKLVVCGVGKSGKIGLKVVATMNSFGIRSTFLHPTEALHGDLGMMGMVSSGFSNSTEASVDNASIQDDTILLITFSGRTPELLTLIPHFSESLPMIVVTSHTHPSTCPLFSSRPSHLSILLPAPIHISEVTSFGLPAPTTSTTTALALTDALALAIARRLHPDPRAVFHAYHPGGAIGASAPTHGPKTVGNIATKVDSVPIVNPSARLANITGRNILLMAAKSPSGWVRLSPTTIIAPRRLQSFGSAADLDCVLTSSTKNMMAIEKPDWISVSANSSVPEARQWVLEMREGARGKDFLKEGTVLGIVDAKGEVSAVVEIEDVVGEDEMQKWGACG